MKVGFMLILSVILIGISGCMDDPVDPEPEEDVSVPEISSSSPSADAVDVDPDVKLEITFAAEVVFESFSLTTFPGDTEITGTLDESDGKTFTFTPDRPLDYNKVHAATFHSVRKESNENEIDVSISFTIAQASFSSYSTPDSHDHDVGRNSFVGMTSDGMIHLTYHNATEGRVYVTSTGDGAFFLDPVVLVKIMDGSDVFAAKIDSTAALHIAYLDFVDEKDVLRYAILPDVHSIEAVTPKIIDSIPNPVVGPAAVPPSILGVEGVVDSLQLTVTFDEGVYSNDDGTGDLEPADFVLTDSDDGRTIEDVEHSAGDNSAVLTLDSVLDDTQDLDVDELAVAEGAVFGIDGSPVGTEAVVIRSNPVVAPGEVSAILAVEGVVGYPRLTVAFDGGVYANDDGTGDLEPADFVLTDSDDGRTIEDVEHSAGDNSAVLTLDSALDDTQDLDVDELAAAEGAVFGIDGFLVGTDAAVIVRRNHMDYLSMDIDDDDKIHIAYYDATNAQLKYATNRSGQWQVEVVDPGVLDDETGKHTSIRVDSTGQVHVSYYDFHPANSNGNLKYAVRDGEGTWRLSSIDTTGDTGMYSSLRVYDGSIYIAYYHPDNSSINLISNESGDWKSTTVVPAVTSETRPSLVIDSMGTMHLSYYKQLSGKMRLCYASKIWEWSIDMTVDASGIGNGVRSSILVDSDGKVHVSYYDVTDKDLKLANQD